MEKAEGEQVQPRIFVLAPTRELAIQIAKDAEVLGKETGCRIGLAFGGTGYEQQRKTILDGIDLLIGTPGRIIDYFKQGVFKLDEIQVAILDEADRMFDLGFIKDIRYLLRRLPQPEERLNMLFSATLSQRVMELAYEHMNEPELIRVEPDKITADKVRQAIFFPSNPEKIPLLVGLIREMGAAQTTVDEEDATVSGSAIRVMVFVNTKREAERVEDYLKENGVDALAISGDVPAKEAHEYVDALPNWRTGRTDWYRRSIARAAHSGCAMCDQLRSTARTGKTTCIGSAAQREQVHLVTRSASAVKPTRFLFRILRNSLVTKSRWPLSIPICCRNLKKPRPRPRKPRGGGHRGKTGQQATIQQSPSKTAR